MRADSPQWQDVGAPATPAEAEALLALKSLLTDSPTTWAWSNLSFIDTHGRTAEVDLVLLTRAGLTVIELKGWHGTITGNQQTWRLDDGTSRPNPLFLTDQKAKRLAGLLDYTQRASRKPVKVPFIRPLVVLHGRNGKLDLDAVAKTAVYGLDGYDVTGVPRLSQWLAQAPTDARDIVDKTRAAQIVRLLKDAGFTAVPRTRMVGQYAVDRAQAADEGPSWRDVIAHHPSMPGQSKRIRLYDVPLDASTEQRARITRNAQREYMLTTLLKHPGVVAPQEFFDSDNGPALVFEHDPDAVPLRAWLDGDGAGADFETKLALIRQLAEVLAYAHARRVTHRGLTPRQVYVTTRDGQAPRVVVRDWQTGREADRTTTGSNTPRMTALDGTRHVSDLTAQDSWVYLAPEIHTADDPDGVGLDVFGLGALTYLILTESPPAPSFPEFDRRMRQGNGLDPGTDLDGIPDSLHELVRRATHPDASLDRTPNVDAFLADLDAAEKSLREADDTPVVDPLDAQPGDALQTGHGYYLVEDRLGSGSTGVALLLLPDDDTGRSLVLKVAHDAAKAHRIDDEYVVLASLDSPRIVKAVAPPFDVHGRRTLLLEDAGRPTLDARIRDEGRLTLDQLERYGADLLEAVAHLDSRGVLHRDIKPANLGVRPDPADRKPRLVLFDFSLSREPLEQIKAGTPPYLDPFLGSAQRPRYDRAAERFAVAVTLYAMATGRLPEWGVGTADPATISDEVTLVPSLFEPSVADGLCRFFRVALARDASKRYGDLAELAQSWAAVFRAADAVTQTPAGDDAGSDAGDRAAERATVATPLAEAGLSARAQSALTRLDVATVGELLATPPFRINQIPGLGEATRREIQRRLRDWRRRLAEPDEQASAAGEQPSNAIDAIARSLAPRSTGRNHSKVGAARLLLGFPLGHDDDARSTGDWPSLADLAPVLDVSRPRVSQLVDDLRRSWRKDPTIVVLADEVVEQLTALSGVAEIHELARALLATHGSVATEPARTRQALGVLRVVVEVELAGDARFANRRIGDAVLLALEPADPDAAGADVRLDHARALGAVADALAPSIPTRTESLLALRRVPSPDGVQLPDERLLAVAALASRTAAVSGRGEIYPRGLAAAEAVRLTLAGSPTGRMVLSPELLTQRVRLRFPEAAPLPGRSALDDLVAKSGAGLRWNGRAYAAETDTTGGLLPTQHVSTALGRSLLASRYDDIDARLRSSLATRSYLTLVVDPRLLDSAAEALVARYGVQRVDLTAELLIGLRELTDGRVDWSLVLSSDAAPVDSPDRAELAAAARRALEDRLPAVLASEQPLLFTGAGPLGRYRAEGWLARLSDLAVPRPAARWLLTPMRGSETAPLLDADTPVPLGTDGWLTIPRDLTTATLTENVS